MKQALTDLSIRKLTLPKTGQQTYWDSNTSGFGIRCSSKSKKFVVRIGVEKRQKTIGTYPDLSLSLARKEAKALQVLANEPSQVLREDISFSEAKERFLKDCEGRTKERTVKDYRRLLNRHFKFTGSLGDVSRNKVMKAVSSLSSTRSEQAHAFVAIRTMMNWLVRHGYLEHSPVPSMTFKTTSRDRVLNHEELKAVYVKSLQEAYPYGPIIQLMILTGQRRTEIAHLRRSWIEKDEVVFPKGFTKNKREHRLPLVGNAKRLLEALPITGDLFFPARSDPEKTFNGWGKCKARFDAGLSISPYTLHDFRRTFSTNMAQLAVPIQVTEKILNHVSGTVSGVAAVYNRYSYTDEMKQALEQYDAFIQSLVTLAK